MNPNPSLNLSRLRNPTIFAISSSWLDPLRLRPLIESFALGKARLPMIEAAHRGLAAVADSANAIDAELATIQSDSQSAATTFGAKVRGLYFTLTGLAELASTPELAAKYTSARDQLLPQGVSVVQWSYTDKMGEAELIAARRTSETDAVLAGVLLLDQTSALEALDALIAAGRTLSQNALRKRELEQRRAALADENPMRDGNQARQFWMRVARALAEDLALSDAAPDVTERILGDLRDAVARSAVTTRRDEDDTDAEATETDSAPPASDATRVVVKPETPANDTTLAVRKVG